MSVIFFILPLALCFAAVSVWAFLWAARKGQYDDLDTPPLRMLIDEEYVDSHETKSAKDARDEQK